MTQKFNNTILAAHAVALEVKASPSGRISGYASTFEGNADRQGDVVLAGAFAASLARHTKSGQMPVMLWAHAQEQPIGRWVHMEEDSKGLFVEGNLNLNTTKGRESFEHIKAGDAGGLSIGFTVEEGGREYVGKGIFNLKKVDLLEVSVVAIPANALARITDVKSLSSKADAIDMLRSCGLSRKAAAIFASGGWNALSGGDHHEQAKQLAAKIEAAINNMRSK
jgi:HK97 family phage prohead protease